jgi:hypothetical protein
LTSIPDGFNPTVGGSLDLRGLTSIPDGFNPTVGGYLDLRGLTSIPDGFNPTVGGSLDLRGLTSIPDGFNPTVGGYLYLRGTSKYINSDTSFLSWQNGKYILVDGEFTEVLNKRGNVFKVKHIGKDKVFYCITDGNSKYSHGDTIKEAREDLIYKISNRSKDDFKGLTLDSKLTFNEAIECYRVITGSCAFGVKNFIESKSVKKKSYKVSDIILITNGAYGGETFKNFFK